jgi:purine nucleosidase
MIDSPWPTAMIVPRARVICDNDYSGDPDGLVQLAHHLLSPSVDIRLVVGSHLSSGDPWDPSPDTADRAVAAARRIVTLAGLDGQIRLAAGSNTALVDRHTPIASAGALGIVAEAMRDDTDVPLFVACGAGLTEIASAWLMEPRIAQRLTVVWIGGHEHDDLAEPPPDGTDMEYNLNIDPVAGQVVFNDSDLNIWQVPRDVYRTSIVSRAELLIRMRPCGELGRYLFDHLAAVVARHAAAGQHLGETYVLGDSPLVLLTALTTAFQPAPASSSHVARPCPSIADSGLYVPKPDGRPLRIYTLLDNRMMLEDLYAKLALHSLAAG